MAYCAAACLPLPAQGTTGNKDLGGGRVPGAWAVATRTPVSVGASLALSVTTVLCTCLQDLLCLQVRL